MSFLAALAYAWLLLRAITGAADIFNGAGADKRFTVAAAMFSIFAAGAATAMAIQIIFAGR